MQHLRDVMRSRTAGGGELSSLVDFAQSLLEEDPRFGRRSRIEPGLTFEQLMSSPSSGQSHLECCRVHFSLHDRCVQVHSSCFEIGKSSLELISAQRRCCGCSSDEKRCWGHKGIHALSAIVQRERSLL